MELIRTPDHRFEELADYAFVPHYQSWRGLRMHYVDEGDGPPVLLLHGEPTWSYLYRHVIPPLVRAGYRCVAPDYVGFGRSDKVITDAWYVVERHVESIRAFIEELDLSQITLVVHDWGGPIGLRSGRRHAGAVPSPGDPEYLAPPPRLRVPRHDPALARVLHEVRPWRGRPACGRHRLVYAPRSAPRAGRWASSTARWWW
jgi:pimeloyl-ACP methyl ester carboxylesterase